VAIFGAGLALGVAGLWVGQLVTPKPPSRVEAPSFELTAQPAITCAVSNGEFSAPCRVTGIFRSLGGAGTQVAVFVGRGSSCKAVIPTTAKGSVVEASCLVAGYLPAGSPVNVTTGP
jgi:hypothetical protein